MFLSGFCVESRHGVSSCGEGGALVTGYVTYTQEKRDGFGNGEGVYLGVVTCFECEGARVVI